MKHILGMWYIMKDDLMIGGLPIMKYIVFICLLLLTFISFMIGMVGLFLFSGSLLIDFTFIIGSGFALWITTVYFRYFELR